MANDRFVTLLEKTVKKEKIEQVLIEFLGTGFPLKWDKDRWFIDVPGTPSHKFGTLENIYREQRFIEVVPSQKSRIRDVDILTRQADPLVSSIADGIVRYICLRLHGDSND
jgi:hypothetical protein